MKNNFSENQITPGIQVKGGSATGGSQPPRNRMVAIAHIVVMATYSPSMNNGFGVDEVEGRPVGFRERRDVEHHEHREQRPDIPVQDRELRQADQAGEAPR